MTMAITRVGKLYNVQFEEQNHEVLKTRIQSAGHLTVQNRRNPISTGHPDSEFTNDDFFSDDEADSNIDADLVEEGYWLPRSHGRSGFSLGVDDASDRGSR